jgi:hypothetical protein
MQRLESKLNVTVHIATINMMIKEKKEMWENQTWVGHTISKYASHCATAINNITRTIQDLGSNKEKRVKLSCILQTNGDVSTSNILARKSEDSLLPYCKTGARSKGYNRPGPLSVETARPDFLESIK